MSRSRISERITEWFHTVEDDVSPQDTVYHIADVFEHMILDRGLQLNVPYSAFVKALCDGTCTLYRATLENKDVGCPTRVANLPKGWSADIENVWTDYVNTFHLTEEFWSSLWYEIPEGVWEAPLHRFRQFLQSVLPHYIQRDLDALEREGLVRQTAKGEFVDAKEDDEEDDYDEYAD
jgi:hypothetical protein